MLTRTLPVTSSVTSWGSECIVLQAKDCREDLVYEQMKST